MTYRSNHKLQIKAKEAIKSARKAKDKRHISLKIGTPLIQTTFN